MYLDLPRNKILYESNLSHTNVTFNFSALQMMDPNKVKLNKVRYFLIIAEDEKNILKRYMCFDKKYQVLYGR